MLFGSPNYNLSIPLSHLAENYIILIVKQKVYINLELHIVAYKNGKLDKRIIWLFILNIIITFYLKNIQYVCLQNKGNQK